MSFTEQKYDTLNTKWRLLNKNMNYWTKIWITQYKLYVVKYCNNPATIPLRCFSVAEKHFDCGVFQKRWRPNNHMISVPESQTERLLRFNLSGVAWNRKHFHVFRAMRKTVACTKTWNAGMPERRNAGILKPGTPEY